MFAGTIAGGILGYVYQVLMGRMMSTAEYGVFSAIMALYAIFSAPLATLLMVVARRVSEYRVRDDFGSLARFYRSTTLFTTVLGLCAAAVCLAFAPQLQVYLRASTPMPIYLFALLLMCSFFPILNDGFLQGLQNFKWLSTSTVIRVLLRIAFSVLLLWLGHGVSGAIVGTILASLAGWIVTFRPLMQPLATGRGRPQGSERLAIKPVVPVLIANTAFAAMTQLDMVLVNYYFAAHDAGIYAAASVLGKAVMYLPSGIAMALFPMVAENHARSQSSSQLFMQAVALTALLCLAGASVYLLLGDWLISVLYGAKYAGAGAVLRYFGFAILPMALVLVAEYFLIAKGRVLFAYLFVGMAPLQVLAIHLWHDSLQTVMMIVGISGAALATAGYAMLWRAFRHERRASGS